MAVSSARLYEDDDPVISDNDDSDRDDEEASENLDMIQAEQRTTSKQDKVEVDVDDDPDDLFGDGEILREVKKVVTYKDQEHIEQDARGRATSSRPTSAADERTTSGPESAPSSFSSSASRRRTTTRGPRDDVEQTEHDFVPGDVDPAAEEEGEVLLDEAEGLHSHDQQEPLRPENNNLPPGLKLRIRLPQWMLQLRQQVLANAVAVANRRAHKSRGPAVPLVPLLASQIPSKACPPSSRTTSTGENNNPCLVKLAEDVNFSGKEFEAILAAGRRIRGGGSAAGEDHSTDGDVNVEHEQESCFREVASLSTGMHSALGCSMTSNDVFEQGSCCNTTSSSSTVPTSSTSPADRLWPNSVGSSAGGESSSASLMNTGSTVAPSSGAPGPAHHDSDDHLVQEEAPATIAQVAKQKFTWRKQQGMKMNNDSASSTPAGINKEQQEQEHQWVAASSMLEKRPRNLTRAEKMRKMAEWLRRRKRVQKSKDKMTNCLKKFVGKVNFPNSTPAQSERLLDAVCVSTAARLEKMGGEQGHNVPGLKEMLEGRKTTRLFELKNVNDRRIGQQQESRGTRDQQKPHGSTISSASSSSSPKRFVATEASGSVPDLPIAWQVVRSKMEPDVADLVPVFKTVHLQQYCRNYHDFDSCAVQEPVREEEAGQQEHLAARQERKKSFGSSASHSSAAQIEQQAVLHNFYTEVEPDCPRALVKDLAPSYKIRNDSRRALALSQAQKQQQVRGASQSAVEKGQTSPLGGESKKPLSDDERSSVTTSTTRTSTTKHTHNSSTGSSCTIAGTTASSTSSSGTPYNLPSSSKVEKLYTLEDAELVMKKRKERRQKEWRQLERYALNRLNIVLTQRADLCHNAGSTFLSMNGGNNGSNNGHAEHFYSSTHYSGLSTEDLDGTGLAGSGAGDVDLGDETLEHANDEADHLVGWDDAAVQEEILLNKPDANGVLEGEETLDREVNPRGRDGEDDREGNTSHTDDESGTEDGGNYVEKDGTTGRKRRRTNFDEEDLEDEVLIDADGKMIKRPNKLVSKKTKKSAGGGGNDGKTDKSGEQQEELMKINDDMLSADIKEALRRLKSSTNFSSSSSSSPDDPHQAGVLVDDTDVNSAKAILSSKSLLNKTEVSTMTKQELSALEKKKKEQAERAKQKKREKTGISKELEQKIEQIRPTLVKQMRQLRLDSNDEEKCSPLHLRKWFQLPVKGYQTSPLFLEIRSHLQDIADMSIGEVAGKKMPVWELKSKFLEEES
ncbi:unnamed protein product [Amoebophrya sp. A120]|nr:unnamed protein product [Amoebophrya sp. A120]|eukprot:GSA120T00021833001.1